MNTDISNLVRTSPEQTEVLIRQEVSRMLAGRYAPEDVEDVIQEAILALLQREGPTDDGVVIGTAKYSALRFLERQPPNEVLESDLGAPDDGEPVSAQQERMQEAKGVEAHRFLTVVTNDTPESLETAADSLALIRAIGATMPAGMFEAFCAVEVDGIGVRRAAKELHVSRATVRKWVRDGRNYLLKEIKLRGVSA